MGNVLKGFPQQFVARIIEDFAQALVDRQPATIEIDVGNADRSLFKGGTEAGLARLQRQLCLNWTGTFQIEVIMYSGGGEFGVQAFATSP